MKRAEVSFSDSLRHLYETTKNTYDNGMKEFSRITTFFQKFTKMQMQFAADLRDLCLKEQEKMEAAKDQDAMQSSADAWWVFFHRIQEVADAHDMFAADLAVYVVKPMEETPNILGISKAAVTDAPIAAKGMQELIKTIEKSKHAALKAIAGLDNATDKYYEEQKTKKLQANKSKVDVARKEALRVCSAYAETIAVANKKAEGHRRDLHSVMRQIQVREESRVTQLQNFLQKYSGLQKSFGGNLQRIADQYTNLASAISIQTDLVEYVNHCVDVAGATPPLSM